MQVHSFFLLFALLVVPFCTSMKCTDKSLFDDAYNLEVRDSDRTKAYNDVASCATLETTDNAEICCYLKVKFKNLQYDETFTQRGCYGVNMKDSIFEAKDIDDIIDEIEGNITLANKNYIEVKKVNLDCNSRFLQFVGLSLLLLLL